MISQLRQSHTVLVRSIEEQVLALGAGNGEVKVHAVTSTLRIGFRHERANHAQIIGDLTGGHAKERESVSRLHRVAVGVVDLELAIGVFMVDLIDIEAHWLERFGELFEKLPGTRQPFIVITRLVQSIAGVDQLELAAVIPTHKIEFRLQARVKRPAFRLEPFYLLLKDVASVVGPWLAIDVTNADDAAIAWLPRNWRQR
ncbi:hypothetical protein D3C75_759060 [compost metagenome]